MRRVCGALALAALLPVSARAEPIRVNVESSSNGFAQTGTTFGGFRSIDFGTITASSVDSVGLIEVNGLRTWSNYTVTFTLQGHQSIDALRVEILDPVDEDDYFDRRDQPSYVPNGYSTSSNVDGFSFAQGASVSRSAVFAGGQGNVFADEITHRGDILLFSGLNGAETARVQFGLRDSVGNRNFLLRFAFEGTPNVPTPEPASMILLGTGLVAMASTFRRRRRNASA